MVKGRIGIGPGRTALRLSVLLPLAAVAALAQDPASPAPAGVVAAPPPLRVVGPQAGFDEVLVLGSGGRFELTPDAPPAHVPVLDGNTMQVASLTGPWEPGPHAIALRSTGSNGEAPPPVAPLHFVYDPGAPLLQWEVGDTKLLDSHGLDQDVDRENPPRHTEPDRDRHVPLLWSPDGRRWLPVLAKGAKPDAQGILAEWLIAADRPQVFLWALEENAFGTGVPIAPQKLQIVRIWGNDALSAVRDLRLRVLPGDASDRLRAYRLELLATDLVGNRTTVSWSLARR